MHPSHAPYWLMASRWESEGDRKGMGGGNTEGARRLCMRALRFLKGAPTEEDVWREWLRVEVVYVERIKKRWELLGIGKKAETDERMDVDDESEQVDVDAVPQTGASKVLDDAAKAVESPAVTGEAAIRDGAVVRLVLDSCLTCAFPVPARAKASELTRDCTAYSHSIHAYTFVITLLRILPSSLRLPLLEHVYTSLAAHHPSTPAATALLATRPMHDLAYDADSPEPKLLDGEALVDAVGQVVDGFWKACKGKKGKGKEREKAPVEVWEAFCEWLEEMEDKSADENLVSLPFCG